MTAWAAPADADLESALEGAANILRVLGNYAFDVGETPASSIRETFDQWASHLLVVGPPPGASSAKSGEEAPRVREWDKLARFVRAHRLGERDHVVQTTNDMRDAIRIFVSHLGRASLEQGKSSKTLRARVDRLRTSVESNSLEELKANALGVAEAVTQALAEQETRMQEQKRELRDKLTRLQQDLEEANREGSTDPLTQLQNRRVFDAALERAVTLGAVIDWPASLLMIDVDHFKSINDRFGHPAGDMVLRTLADTLSRSFPRRGDVVARYGGEEFVVLLGETTENAAQLLAARLLGSIRKLSFELGGQAHQVTVSAGVGQLRADEDGDELVRRVDRALYAAKRGGRDRVVVASSAHAVAPMRKAG